MIKVIIIDDQKLIREGLKMILSLDDEIKIIGEGENGLEAVSLCRDLAPDVVLMDIRMPIMDGVLGTEKVKELNKEIKILILTTFNEDEYIFKSIKNGANGYILKDAEPDEIIDAIKTVFKGNMLIDSEVALRIAGVLNKKEGIELDSLTNREREVAMLIAEGFNNKEIGDKLFLSEGTIKNYVTKILDKLNLKNRTELAVKIREN